LIHLNMALIADYQASKIAQPSKRAFNFPSFLVSSKLPAVLLFTFRAIAPIRNNQIYFQLLTALSKRVAVISFVTDKSFGALFRSASTATRNVDCIESFFGKFYFRRRCRGKEASQRNTLAVDHHHPFRSFAFFGFADASAPFFAGAKLPSIKASSQSSSPSASSMDRNLRHISSHTPWSSHRRNRLQHVAGLGYRSGKSCHRAPVRKIQSMPSKTWRLSMAGRPPFGLVFGSGSSGFNSFHCSSFMNRVYSAIGSPPIA